MPDPPITRASELPPEVVYTSAALRLLPAEHRPVVVADANALISDSRRSVEGMPRILLFLAERNLIKLVSARHIDGKVYEHMADACANSNTDPRAAIAAYEQFYRPRVRFVDPGDLMLGDPQVLSVKLADTEDTPIAQLGVLLAPSLVLTRDKHLLEAGVGVKEWADALIVAEQLLNLEAMMLNGVHGSLVMGRLAQIGVQGLARLLRTSETAQVVALGGLAALLLFGRDWLGEIPGRLQSTRDQLVAAAERASERQQAAQDQLNTSLLMPNETQSAEGLIARLLLYSDSPVSAKRIGEQLRFPIGRTLASDELLPVLREQPAFVFAPGRGWTLGTRTQNQNVAATAV